MLQMNQKALELSLIHIFAAGGYAPLERIFETAGMLFPDAQEKAAGWELDNLHRNGPVSYTHLDVYKRQGRSCSAGAAAMSLQQCMRTI